MGLLNPAASNRGSGSSHSNCDGSGKETHAGQHASQVVAQVIDLLKKLLGLSYERIDVEEQGAAEKTRAPR
jgi:hypothetical protein